MRTLLATPAVLVIALPLAAQSPAAIELSVDVHPPAYGEGEEHAEWVPGTGNGVQAGLVDFRIRAEGTEAGWVHPVLGVAVGDEVELPAWLSAGESPPASQMNWHGAELPAGDPDRLVWRRATCQAFVDLAFLNGYPTSQTDGVKWWCQPMLTPQPNQIGLHASTRVWHSAPPLWTGSIGERHRAQWMALLTDLTPGSEPPRMDCFSGGAALRQAIVLQSIIATGSIAPAYQFLNSSSFKSAVSTGALTLMIQIFAARAAAALIPDGNYDDDDEVPDLENYQPPPSVGISPATRWVVMWPNHSGTHVHGFDEPEVTPGRVMTFISNYATAPIVVEFSTTNGPQRVLARATPSVYCPGGCSVRVPENVSTGPVRYKAGLDTSFMVVGVINMQSQSMQ